MGIISSGSNGNLRGKVGDQVYRQENGRTIVYSYTKKLNTTSKEAKKNRNNFGICNTICSVLIRSQVLNGIWNDYPGNGKMHLNKAISLNRPFLKSIEDLDKIIIAPADSYFNAEILDISSDSRTLSITVSSVCSSVNTSKWRISAQGLYYWKRITPEGGPEEILESTCSDTKLIIPEEPMSFDLTLRNADAYNFFPDKKFVVNLIVYDMKGKPVEASVNLTGSF